MTLFEDRPIAVPREKIEGARKIASEHRRLAENQYRETLATASRWELYASLLEQGYSIEEANRRAFHPRVES